jgi:hypothetical protein
MAIPNDEIRNVIGKTTVTTAIASGPIHCPTNIVSIRMFRDMNKIPIEQALPVLSVVFYVCGS